MAAVNFHSGSKRETPTSKTSIRISCEPARTQVEPKSGKPINHRYSNEIVYGVCLVLPHMAVMVTGCGRSDRQHNALNIMVVRVCAGERLRVLRDYRCNA